MTRVTFHGHSCSEIEHEEHRLNIDPFLTHHPAATVRPELFRVQYVLVTHDHGDHFTMAGESIL